MDDISAKDEKAALAWLETCASYVSQKLGPSCSAADSDHRATIKRLLARPALPEEPSDNALKAMILGMSEGRAPNETWAHSVYRALYQHLTRLKTKTVEVWRLEFAKRHHVTRDWLPDSETWPRREHLDLKAEEMRENPEEFACIRVTGPHTQEVPADD